ncbi:MAG: zinc ribbon domain-containing protein [Terracidiphilus sp.]
MPNCTKCGQPLGDGAEFCAQCGAAVKYCPKCGQPLKAGAMFCAQCGAAVRYCLKCGQPLKEGAMFCAHCGAAANEVCPDFGASVSPSAPPTGAYAAQGSMTLGRVRFTIPKPSLLQLNENLRLAHYTNTVFVDGYAVRTIEMGETVEFDLPVGTHAIQLEHKYSGVSTLGLSIQRMSNLLQVPVVAGMLPVVTGEYNYLWWKFNLNLQ